MPLAQIHEFLAAMSADGLLSERIIYALYREVVPTGGTCFDVGASLGLHTRALAKLVGPSGAVYAFEAIPFYAQKLIDWSARQHLPQVSVINKAVWKEKSNLAFHWIRNKPGYSGINLRNASENSHEVEQIEVDAVSLDSLFPGEGLGGLTFIKMDIEGAEFPALLGAESLLKRYRPLIVFEGAGERVAQEYNYSMDDFFEFFARVGYRICDILGQEFSARTYRQGPFAWNFVAEPAVGPIAGFTASRLPPILEAFRENQQLYGEVITYRF